MALFQLETKQVVNAASVPLYRQVQNRLWAICIILAPLTLTIYLLSWISIAMNGSAVAYSQSIASQSLALNQVHLLAGLLASLFLPLGFFGMALLGMRHSPWLATIAAIFGLVGWLPFSAIVSIDNLIYEVARTGSTPQLAALWVQFNGSPMITAYQYIYIIGHEISAILLGVLLSRARLVPGWTAWALALSSPAIAFLFMFHLVPQFIWIVPALYLIGMVPAAIAMWQSKGDR